ncbi:MAG: hypothetical protein WB780_00250 [Candidatus Acidiferrales bacterium]
MRKVALILGLAVLLSAAFVVWQVSLVYVANFQLRSDLNAMAVDQKSRLGGRGFDSEAELRKDVITHARERGIQLKPEQVTVERITTWNAMSVSLTADYDATVNLLLYSYTLHFQDRASTASSTS